MSLCLTLGDRRGGSRRNSAGFPESPLPPALGRPAGARRFEPQTVEVLWLHFTSGHLKRTSHSLFWDCLPCNMDTHQCGTWSCTGPPLTSSGQEPRDKCFPFQCSGGQSGDAFFCKAFRSSQGVEHPGEKLPQERVLVSSLSSLCGLSPLPCFPSQQDLTPAPWGHHPNEYLDDAFCVQSCFGRKLLRQYAEEQLCIWCLLRSMSPAQCPRAARSSRWPGVAGGRAPRDMQRAAQLWASLPGVLAADPPWSRERRGLEGSFPGSWGYHRPCSFGHPSPLTPVGFAQSIPTVPIIQNRCSSDEVNDIISEQAAEWVIWEAAGKLGASWPLSWAAVPRAG